VAVDDPEKHGHTVLLDAGVSSGEEPTATWCAGEMLGRADYLHSPSKERIVRLERAICHLILHERSLIARVAARDANNAEAAMRRIAEALPEVNSGDRDVPARFWWSGPNGPRSLARMLPSVPWGEIQDN
jgi:hypothetical protein